ALVESRALVWFATHFRDLAIIMAERAGVVNLHLAVESSEQDKMEMLYRIASGTAREEHYGLKLARVVPLPGDVVEHAELVARTLEQQVRRRKKRSLAIIQARRRKLLLNLREHLVQAQSGTMGGGDLTQWLREFVVRMTALDEEAGKAELGVEEEEEGEEEAEESDEADDGDREATAVATQRGLPPELGDGLSAMDIERLRKQAVRQRVILGSDGAEAIDEIDSQVGSSRSMSAPG
ncbi:hypothetical protein B0A55_13740, partial [Friedmanniomyces simplex]